MLEKIRGIFGAEGSDSALLLPLIKILPSPRTEENACYYYSRRDSNKVRYLTYHFGADSERERSTDGTRADAAGAGSPRPLV
jgi:hypothetical protein